MAQLVRAQAGMVVAPHHLAAEAGCAVLREGGNAVEAMIAASATIMVAYPHMNALGGDNFWLISKGGGPPIGIDAAGPAAGIADIGFYRDLGHTEIPSRGPLAALTVAGAVSGWQAALEISAGWGGRMPLDRLLETAAGHARDGVTVPHTLHANAASKRGELEDIPGFADVFLPGGAPVVEGTQFKQPRVAATLERLSLAGLDDFYRGDLGRSMAKDLEAAGSPVRLGDLEAYNALPVEPLSLALEHARVYNMPPPTQGLASLIILGIFERLGIEAADGFDYVHSLVESAKQAFLLRDAHVTDPAYMDVDPADFLSANALDERANAINPDAALAWPQEAKPGDTVWLGAIDSAGNAVSFIQSVYWEFGSGLVLPESGVLWQNRGTSFALDDAAVNALKPGRRPFHTIQPALALFSDGRVMLYGAMGGEGQPQTQSVIYTRYAHFGQDLAQAISGPRWLLGRTWGAETANLRVESRFAPDVIEALRAAGHELVVVGAFDAVMGHAGALVRHPDGSIEGASDPRCDGAAVGF
ncbi:MAG: gamma-glutamyltransferase family protein [Proteobacteria bacterium]|nr:gamma-glutamyltransferase family protein [Pseudomonadota bacterium]